jgi:hypothetical protein
MGMLWTTIPDSPFLSQEDQSLLEGPLTTDVMETSSQATFRPVNPHLALNPSHPSQQSPATCLKLPKSSALPTGLSPSPSLVKVVRIPNRSSPFTTGFGPAGSSVCDSAARTLSSRLLARLSVHLTRLLVTEVGATQGKTHDILPGPEHFVGKRNVRSLPPLSRVQKRIRTGAEALVGILCALWTVV